MEKIYEKSSAFLPIASGFCPGCMHGIAMKSVVETLDKLGVTGKALAVLPIGCATLNMFYLNMDALVAAHGRAPAVATGYKRCRPDNVVFTYQGDGDLAAIGMAEIMHCANRGENITTIFINNGIYGMTGGQMAPTTLVGQKATTAPGGRDPGQVGYPFKMAELIASLEAPTYVARFALNSIANVMKARAGIEKAFRNQLAGKGYSFIELLSNCPTNWGVTPLESIKWINEKTIPYFPLGEFKNK